MESNERMEEVTRENAIIIWQASRLSIGMKCEKAPEILKANGTVVGTLGNFSASIGKAKSKKTFNVSAIVAAALKNGTVLCCIRRNCPRTSGKSSTLIPNRARTIVSK